MLHIGTLITRNFIVSIKHTHIHMSTKETFDVIGTVKECNDTIEYSPVTSYETNTFTIVDKVEHVKPFNGKFVIFTPHNGTLLETRPNLFVSRQGKNIHST